MPKDDYTSTPGGLKLKGAKNAGISKNKKKKTKVKPAESSPAQASLIDDPTELANPAEQRPQSSGAAAESSLDADVQREDDAEMNARSRSPAGSASPAPTPSGETKTEAERRHEEMRRKRLSERLAREGIKTHKERVEELNKYLSTLSEHHDMPRIGPG